MQQPISRLHPARAASVTALLFVAACLPVLASPKFQIVFPDEPYAVAGSNDAPGWVKFTILTNDLTKVYFQDSHVHPFHYSFAISELPQFQGMTPAQFDQATLYEQGQQAILGAVILPPLSGGNDVYPEYGIQLVRQDPYPPALVRDLFYLVRSKVLAGPQVQALYFPTFEQQPSAEQNAAYFASQGIAISSTERWADGNSCYSPGWALGTLKYFPPDQIDGAYLAGMLAPDDVLLTDGVPAEIPAVAGVISLAPATPSSHVAILAQTFRLPFVHLALAADAQLAQALVGRRIVLRSDVFLNGVSRVRLVDVEEQLDAATIAAILALKDPPPLDIEPMTPRGAYSAPAGTLQLADVRYFGGKASNFGVIRRAIPASSPVATAFSFDLWNAFLDQVLGNGRTLRQEIALRLTPYDWPPDMSDLAATLAGIRDLIRDTGQTAFPAALQSAVIGTLQDPQYGFNPDQNLRFRSSTNVEDSEQFTGAGLYDSFSGCLADDLDANTPGPSLCDPTESNERGVFRAIRRVFASFYNLNAYLERLRYEVSESQVGMALLVHHSFPDPIEMANGVGLLRKGSGSNPAQLVTQAGASSVTNPEPGAIPEEVRVDIYSGSLYPTLVQPSNLVPLGDTVMDYPDDYEELTGLLQQVVARYATESGLGTFLLDFEYKKVASGGAAFPAGGLEVDQVRRLPQASNTPSITPFLINEPREYCVYQGEYADVFANHRLKLRWTLSTQNLWLTPQNLASSFFADSPLQYAETCQLYEQTGPPSQWPAAFHSFASSTSTDGFSFPSLQDPRSYALRTFPIPTLVPPSRSPLLVLGDFGWPYSGPDAGCLELAVDYAEPVPSLTWSAPSWTTHDEALLCGCPSPQVGDLLQQRTLNGPNGVTIVTRFYWPPPPEGITAGYTAPLVRFVDTVISGLTSTPITLVGEYSQTYRPEHHNFGEHFLFEPALEPGLPQAQLAELQAAGIRAIHARDSFTYYDDAAWGGACLGCTGFDADSDGFCTGEPLSDCNDTNASVWSRPGETPGLSFADHVTLVWGAPVEPGALSLVYDALRSTSWADFVGAATCIESDGADLSASDVAVPGPGAVLYYLVRAQNGCPGGAGTLGHRSDGTERTGRTCP